MADVHRPHQVQVHPQRFDPSGKGGVMQRGGLGAGGGPSPSKIIAVLTGLPVGGTLFFLAGLSFIGSIIGFCVCFPLFIIFSPVLVPAGLAVGLAVTAFLASGAFGLTGLSALSYVLTALRQARMAMPEQLDMAKRRMQDMAGYVGQKTQDVGQEIQKKSGTATQEGK
ncbi:hypothetical protein ACFE04_006093 [Oxalis oulophora]